ncbi:tRNA lysidine(34) synthetase TilS [Clostridium sp. SM-530-WT-3G]|uniref:tRNA lysidine(34) synthetase TilS n=1 Tax=Clostridium sp. SM-530-WT-3G TaxID=2725303 RepID=UPI00145CE0F1|nr:tRNA lysidine(34) synthetase TilS [Clostridium sp. SM-530-WT-3G]NME84167.1 tRNA lysidine(34) synthetase TilS [Clostridium sp. SM-530-WT-3G]
MYKKVLSYIRDNKLIESGDKVLIALSGGPDSVCLLNILFKLKDELNIELGAAHLNHMLRGKDAMEDEQYVIDICKQMNVECFTKQVNINEYSKKEKLSSEMAGRIVRYNFFDEIIKEHGYTKIATAHNANDQAETILFRLMRGTGLEGLGGIKTKRDNIIRPILCLSRQEVEEYIHTNQLEPRIDKTNFEKIYNRNKIRLDMLPYIKKNFNEDIVQTLNRMAVLLQKDNEFIEQLSMDMYKKYCIEKPEYFIIKEEVFDENEAMVTRIIRNAVTNFSKTHYDFEMRHIYEIYNLAQNGTGKIVDLPNKIYAENIYGDIYIKSKMDKDINCNITEINLPIDNIDTHLVEFGEYSFKFSIVDNSQKTKLNLKRNNYEKYFDFDKIQKEIIIRTRKDGDKIIPLGMTGSKKLKDIFINMKIPKEERDIIPIVCFDNKISWIVGLRVSDEYKVTSDTKKILIMNVKRKEY